GEALHRRCVPTEDLEVDGRTQARCVRRLGGRACEAAVADGGDAGAKTLVRPVGRDRAHLVEVEKALPPDMQADPRREIEPVPEAGVHRVLEVRVAVHEARQDPAPRERLALPEVGGAADGRDPPVVADRDRAAAYRVALDRDDPVGGDESHRASAAARSQRRSMKTEIQMDASKSTRSGTVSSTSDTGRTGG